MQAKPSPVRSNKASGVHPYQHGGRRNKQRYLKANYSPDWSGARAKSRELHSSEQQRRHRIRAPAQDAKGSNSDLQEVDVRRIETSGGGRTPQWRRSAPGEAASGLPQTGIPSGAGPADLPQVGLQLHQYAESGASEVMYRHGSQTIPANADKTIDLTSSATRGEGDARRQTAAQGNAGEGDLLESSIIFASPPQDHAQPPHHNTVSFEGDVLNSAGKRAQDHPGSRRHMMPAFDSARKGGLDFSTGQTPVLYSERQRHPVD